MAERLYRIKSGGAWHAWFYDRDGKQVRFSTRCTDQRAAAAVLRDRERAALAASGVPAHEPAAQVRAATSPTIEEALRHMIRQADTDKSEATRRFYREKAGHVLRLLGGLELDRLHYDDVQRYIGQRITEQASRSTVSKELIALRKALKLARLRGDFDRDPRAVIPAFSVEYRPRRRWLTVADAGRLLEATPAPRRLWLALAMFSSARASEVEGVRWEHVDLRGRQIFIPGTKTRGSERWVPLMPELEGLLRAESKARGGKPAGYVVEHWGNVRRDLAAACERASIERVTPNDLRRTFASWLKQRGVDSLAVSKLLGHSSTRMVELVYGQLDSATLRRAVDEMPRVQVPRGAPTPRDKYVINAGATGGLGGRPGNPGSSKTPKKTVPRGGIEPPTRGFSVRCSTS